MKKAVTVLGAVSMAGGLLIAVCAKLYHVAVRPEWTEAMALHHQWHVYGVSLILVLGGLWVWEFWE